MSENTVRFDTGSAQICTTAGVPDGSRRPAWAGVVALALGIFTLVTSEFLPVSLLPDIAKEFGVADGTAGLAVTATAIMGAITAPTIGVIVPRLDRRILILILSAISITSNLLVANAPSVWLLIASRMLLGVAIAGSWSMALAVTAQLVSPSRIGRALTVINAGALIATVVAVPLGALLGEAWGWRAVFLLAGGAGVIALMAQLVFLPSVKPQISAGFRTIVGTLRTPIVLIGLTAVALIAAGHFAGFTYFRPAAAEVPGLTIRGVSLLLFLFGGAGIIGNLMSGPIADGRLRILVLLVPLLISIGMVTFAYGRDSLWIVTAAIAVWGLGFGGVGTTLQTWMARVEPHRLESIGGLFVATFQAAIALGSLVGGLLVDSVGVTAALTCGGVAAAVGGLILGTRRI